MYCFLAGSIVFQYTGAWATANQPQTRNNIQFHCALERAPIPRTLINWLWRNLILWRWVLSLYLPGRGTIHSFLWLSLIKSTSLFHGTTYPLSMMTYYTNIHTHTAWNCSISNGVFFNSVQLIHRFLDNYNDRTVSSWPCHTCLVRMSREQSRIAAAVSERKRGRERGGGDERTEQKEHMNI